MTPPALAILHEHPDWFRPLFAELDRRGIAYTRLDAAAVPVFYDPAEGRSRFAVFFNRMSPSAYLRGRGSAIRHTLDYLRHLERLGVRTVNGSRVYAYEVSKAAQLTLLAELGLSAPLSWVIHRGADAPAAASGLRFPVVVKTNVGGSGAGIERFDSADALQTAADAGRVELGLDEIALVQEFVPARDGHITRVETLGGKYLYAIDVYPEASSFDLCPADACQTKDGGELARSATSACPVEAPRRGLRVEAVTPAADVIAACERIAQAAGLVGTPERVAERVAEFAAVGVSLLLLQCSPQAEEMERFAAQVIRRGEPT